MPLRIVTTSVMVDDQQKALDFYTKVLGFLKKTDVPVGSARWLTVVSPYTPDGVEVLLEPNFGHPGALTFQKGLHDAGIPATMFGVDDVEKEYARLKKTGVKFTAPPTVMGTVQAAIFDDTCGNLIVIAERPPEPKAVKAAARRGAAKKKAAARSRARLAKPAAKARR